MPRVRLFLLLILTAANLHGTSSSPSDNNNPIARREKRHIEVAAQFNDEEDEKAVHLKSQRLLSTPTPPLSLPQPEAPPELWRPLSTTDTKHHFWSNKILCTWMLECMDYRYLCKFSRLSKRFHHLTQSLLLPTQPKQLPTGETLSVGKQWAMRVHEIIERSAKQNRPIDDTIREIAALAARCSNPLATLNNIISGRRNDTVQAMRPYILANKMLSNLVRFPIPTNGLDTEIDLYSEDGASPSQLDQFRHDISIENAIVALFPSIQASLSLQYLSPYSSHTQAVKEDLGKTLDTLNETYIHWGYGNTAWLFELSDKFRPVTQETIAYENIIISQFTKRIQSLIKSIQSCGCDIKNLSGALDYAQKRLEEFVSYRCRAYMVETFDEPIKSLVAHRPAELIQAALAGGCRPIQLYTAVGREYANAYKRHVGTDNRAAEWLRQALIHTEQALALAERREEPNLELLQETSRYHRILATCHNQEPMTHLLAAESQLKKVAELNQTILGYECLAKTSLRLARLYFETGNEQEAIRHCDTAYQALLDAKSLFDKYAIVFEATAKQVRHRANYLKKYPAAAKVVDMAASYVKSVQYWIMEMEGASTQVASQSTGENAISMDDD